MNIPYDYFSGPIPEILRKIVFTHFTYKKDVRWMTRLPRQLSFLTNLLRVFDKNTWILTFIMASVGFSFMFMVQRLMRKYSGNQGVWQLDFVVPLEMEETVSNEQHQKVISMKKLLRQSLIPNKGKNVAIFLIVWSWCAWILVMAFESLALDMTILPVMEDTVDSTKDILDMDKLPLVRGLFLDGDTLMATLIDLNQRKVGYQAVSLSRDNVSAEYDALANLVYKHGTHAFSMSVDNIERSSVDQRNNFLVNFF